MVGEYGPLSTMETKGGLNVNKKIKRIIYFTHYAKRDLLGIAKSIDPGQLAQSDKADHGGNFSLMADFQCIK